MYVVLVSYPHLAGCKKVQIFKINISLFYIYVCVVQYIKNFLYNIIGDAICMYPQINVRSFISDVVRSITVVVICMDKYMAPYKC